MDPSFMSATSTTASPAVRKASGMLQLARSGAKVRRKSSMKPIPGSTSTRSQRRLRLAGHCGQAMKAAPPAFLIIALSTHVLRYVAPDVVRRRSTAASSKRADPILTTSRAGYDSIREDRRFIAARSLPASICLRSAGFV